MHFDLNECEIGRYLLGPPGILIVSLSIVLQFALIYVSFYVFNIEKTRECKNDYTLQTKFSLIPRDKKSNNRRASEVFSKHASNHIFFQAILKSPTHSKNVCYHTILIIGILTLLQLFFQFEVFLDLFACGSISPLADAVSYL
jgi:hypothetical protein